MSAVAGGAAGVLRPRSLAEALELLAEAARAGTPLMPLAGGTDIFVGMHFGTLTGTGTGTGTGGGREPERRFLDLWGLAELRHIVETDATAEGNMLRFGALTTYTDCVRSPLVGRRLPILAAASKEVGGVQIQNRGTLGGNIANASPAGDAIPVLMAADAEVVLASVTGERAVPLADYYTGYRASVRRPDELIVAVRTPVPAGRQVFRKVGTRAAQAISKVVLAAVGHRVAFGSVAPVVMRARKVEAYLVAGGRDLTEAQRLLLEEIRPIDDVRSTAAYRRRVAANLLADVVRSL